MFERMWILSFFLALIYCFECALAWLEQFGMQQKIQQNLNPNLIRYMGLIGMTVDIANVKGLIYIYDTSAT